jgi:hypothetical protein
MWVCLPVIIFMSQFHLKIKHIIRKVCMNIMALQVIQIKYTDRDGLDWVHILLLHITNTIGLRPVHTHTHTHQ